MKKLKRHENAETVKRDILYRRQERIGDVAGSARDNTYCTGSHDSGINYIGNDKYKCSVRRKWINQKSTRSKRGT